MYYIIELLEFKKCLENTYNMGQKSEKKFGLPFVRQEFFENFNSYIVSFKLRQTKIS